MKLAITPGNSKMHSRVVEPPGLDVAPAQKLAQAALSIGIQRPCAADRQLWMGIFGVRARVADCARGVGVWVARVNPRQVRDFARATGQLAKTDTLDARMLAEMVDVLRARLRRRVPAPPWQAELKAWLVRRLEVTDTLQRSHQQSLTAPTLIRATMKNSLVALRRKPAAIDVQMRKPTQQHATPAARLARGLGPVFQATDLAMLPELGQLCRQQIAKLASVARSIATAARCKKNG